MSTIYELIEEIKDERERKELLNDYLKTNEYKEDILKGIYNQMEITIFINQIINKYRFKPEVIDYYVNSSNNNNINPTIYETLCTIENMIFTYAERKTLESLKDRKE